MSVKTTIVDLKKEWASGNRSLFSRLLTERIRHALAHKRQVILYLNKRGFSSAFTCLKCGSSIHCPHCDVTLVLHKEYRQPLQASGQSPSGTRTGFPQGSLARGKVSDVHEAPWKRFLLCHVCGRVVKVPTTCPACKSDNVKFVGIGTQKVTEVLRDLFPQARVARADRDSTRTKYAFETLYHDFQEGKTDILVGTQIVAKGLDVANVALIGVLFADMGLQIPDFRSSERVFASIMQVGGRTGRLGCSGEIIIQTLLPNHPAIAFAAKRNYEGFYEREIHERKVFRYPPFTRIIKLMMVDKDQAKAQRAAKSLHDELAWVVQHAMTPEEKTVEVSLAPALTLRTHDRYHYHVLLKGKNPRAILDQVKLPRGWRVDVDPVSLV